MTRIGVVTRDAYKSWEMKALARAAKRHGAELLIIDPVETSVELTSGRPIAAGGEPISLDAALGRIDAACLDAGVRLLELMAGALPVLNGARAFRLGRDKRLMTHALAQAGVPHPRTWLVSPRDLPRMAPRLPYPLVVKPPLGSSGRGVLRVTSPRALIALAKERKEPMYLQAFCRGIQEELRLLVLDGQLIGAARRTPRRGEWRANLALGGRFEKAAVGAEEERAGLLAAEAVGADFAGVDLARGPHGPIVLEVNVCPGFRGFASATGVDVASLLVNAVFSRIGKEGVTHESGGIDGWRKVVEGP